MKRVLGTTLLLGLIMMILMCNPVKSQSDPYVIQGKTHVNGEIAPNITVNFIYDRYSDSKTVLSDFNGTYVIPLFQYSEGDSYTIKAGYNEFEGIYGGRFILYDRSGYKKEGDIVDIYLTETEPEKGPETQDFPFLLLFLPICLFIPIYLMLGGKD